MKASIWHLMETMNWLPFTMLRITCLWHWTWHWIKESKNRWTLLELDSIKCFHWKNSLLSVPLKWNLCYVVIKVRCLPKMTSSDLLSPNWDTPENRLLSWNLSMSWWTLQTLKEKRSYNSPQDAQVFHQVCIYGI